MPTELAAFGAELSASEPVCLGERRCGVNVRRRAARHMIQRDATQSRMVYAEIKCETRWLMHSVSWVLPSCLLVLKAFRLARGLLQTALGMASDVTQTDCL